MNNNLISIENASNRYNKSIESFWVSACLFKKKEGKYPDWYFIDFKGNAKINITYYEKWANIERRAWLYSTNDLYYILSYDFGLSDTKIARFMARHSRKFTIETSWMSFVSKTLFSLPQSSILQKRITMNIEFFVIGTYLIKLLLDSEKNKL